MPLPTHASSLELSKRFSEYSSGKTIDVHNDIDDVPLKSVHCAVCLILLMYPLMMLTE